MGLFSKLKSPLPHGQSTAYGSNPSSYAPPSPPRQPNNPDPRVLPSGWISQFDPNSQRFFYVYTPTGLRQWEHPADKSINGARGENSSYGQPGYGQPQYVQQSQYAQKPVYAQQQQMAGTSRFGSGSSMGMGKMAALGIGGGLLGYMIGDAIGDSHQPDIIENNYYDNDNNYGGGFDGGGGGFDGGFGDGGFDDF